MALSASDYRLIKRINDETERILHSGGNVADVLGELSGSMSDLIQIIKSTSPPEMDSLCKKLPGFYEYMKILETVVTGVSSGDLDVPTEENDTAFDELQAVMRDALFQMKKLINEDSEPKANFVSMASLFVTGVMSTAADLSEIAQPGSSSYLYSEIETAAKKGGLQAIKEFQAGRGNRYSISDIDEDDFVSGMNYLGQQISAALFKHIHDLPKSLRKPEMLLRAVETMLANLGFRGFAPKMH